jgi:hypothetical protein
MSDDLRPEYKFGYGQAKPNRFAAKLRPIVGERVKRTRLIQTEQYVVAVEVDVVIPPDDAEEPCFEAETVQFLKEVRERAERGDVAWLRQHGKVYAAVGAA